MTQTRAQRRPTTNEEATPLGSVHGFDVYGRGPMAYLRPAAGHDPLTIVAGSTPPRPTGSKLAELRTRSGPGWRLYESADGFNVDFDQIGWYHVDVDRARISTPATPYPAWLEATTLGLPVALLVLARGGLFFHAAAVEIAGHAVILAAPGYHGKTTLAGALLAAGHRLLSEDLVRCNVGETTTVHPGPALIRLRRDVAEWLDIPGATPVADDQGKIYYALSDELRGTGEPLPLGAIVFLHRSDGGAVELSRIDPLAALRDLWAVTLNVPTPGGRAQCFSQITSVAQQVPLWKLSRPLTRDALAETIDRVVATVAGVEADAARGEPR